MSRKRLWYPRGKNEIPTNHDSAAVCACIRLHRRWCILPSRNSTERAVGAFKKAGTVSLRLSDARRRDFQVARHLPEVQNETGAKTSASKTGSVSGHPETQNA